MGKEGEGVRGKGEKGDMNGGRESGDEGRERGRR